jgi:hypothetical protein
MLGKRLTLHALLEICNLSEPEMERMGATDPRDRVFALLGIATDDAAKDIVPDYTLSCEDSYILAARALFKHGHDDILSLCRKREVCKSLPSWVPDWSAMNQEPWAACSWEDDVGFNPSDDSDSFHELRINSTNTESKLSRVLSLEAVFVDRVEEVGQIWSPDVNKSLDHNAARQYFEDISTYLSRSERYTTSQKEDAEWRLPVGDIQYQEGNFQVERASNGSRMKIGYKAFRREVNGETEAADTPRDMVSYSHFTYRLDRMYDCRPFLTSKGYVGLCQMETRSGDSVVILIGARVPYVVRPKDGVDSWTLVGESHVYGIMNGEFMRQDPKPTVVDIKLH